MEKEKLFELLIPKERDLEIIANSVINNQQLLPFLMEGINSSNVRIRYGCFNLLVLLSEKAPQFLYPHFDFFVDLLNSYKNVFVLGSINILSNLAPVDKENKIDKIFDKLYLFIKDPEMTPGANLIKSSPTIAKAKPHLIEKIVKYLLSVEMTNYKTVECKNILIGKVVTAFSELYNLSEKKNEIIKFVETCITNELNATKKKAESFLKKHNVHADLSTYKYN